MILGVSGRILIAVPKSSVSLGMKRNLSFRFNPSCCLSLSIFSCSSRLTLSVYASDCGCYLDELYPFREEALESIEARSTYSAL